MTKKGKRRFPFVVEVLIALLIALAWTALAWLIRMYLKTT